MDSSFSKVRLCFILATFFFSCFILRCIFCFVSHEYRNKKRLFCSVGQPALKFIRKIVSNRIRYALKRKKSLNESIAYLSDNRSVENVFWMNINYGHKTSLIKWSLKFKKMRLGKIALVQANRQLLFWLTIKFTRNDLWMRYFGFLRSFRISHPYIQHIYIFERMN